MAVFTTPQIRVSVNNQSRNVVRTVGVAAKTRFKLSELEDVDASGAENNEVIVYDSERNMYVVKAISSLDGGFY